MEHQVLRVKNIAYSTLQKSYLLLHYFLFLKNFDCGCLVGFFGSFLSFLPLVLLLGAIKYERLRT